jgi:hypothetical protein
VVVSRSKIKDYQPVEQRKETYLLTKSKKIIRLSLVQNEKCRDSFLRYKAPAKWAKEQGIKNKLDQRYMAKLEFIKKGLFKPRGIKKADKVQQRIDRVKQKYSSIHHL